MSGTTPNDLYILGSSGGINMTISGNSIALDQSMPIINNNVVTSNIKTVDDSLFNNSSTSLGGLVQNDTKTGLVAVSLTGTSTTNTSTSGTTNNTTNTNTSTNPSTQQTPQRAKKICLMRIKLFNVVP
jgi:hypothetical protein